MHSVEEIKAAISAFFGDTSRTREETREGLEDIVAETELLLEALQD